MAGSRRRYLAEQAAFMEEKFGKAEGFTTPITKPAASFKAPSTGLGGAVKPKIASLKPTGNTLPTPTARLSALKQSMVGQTGSATGAPSAVGTTGGVGKADKLRRKGQFQRLKASQVAKSYIPGVGYKPAHLLSAAERAAAATRRGARGALHQRGPASSQNGYNQHLRTVAQDTTGHAPSNHPQITFGSSVSAADRARVLRIAPKKLKGGKVHVDHYPDSRSTIEQIMGAPQPEGYVRAGSRRVPSQLHLKPGTADHTIAHEFTHANRKSLNAHRFRQITSDPAKLGREEGRADGGAARQGHRSVTPTGSFDYEQLSTLAGSKNKLYRWGNKKLGPNSAFNMAEYSRVRNKMGTPLPDKISRGNHKLLRGNRRNERINTVAAHPATIPALAVASSVPIYVKQQRDAKKARLLAAQRRNRVAKREPLKTSVSEDDARKLVERHGLKGPLPKGLDREQKMAAYEARYVSAGGKKAEKWDRRARHADKVKTGGLAVATVGGAGWLATRGKGPKPSAINQMMNVKRLRHHTETVAGAGAVVGGSGELYAAHARRKRSSYASAPAGVAASALRRMQDYTP